MSALEWIPASTAGRAPRPTMHLVWFRAFGVFSLATLALTAFLLIFVFVRIRDPDVTDRWSAR